MNSEKILKGLECCSLMNGHACSECPYSSECIAYETEYPVGIAHLAADALIILREQEERIKLLEHQLETLTRWRMNAGAFD